MCVPDIQGKLTPLGNVVIETNRETGHVIVRLRPRDGVSLRHGVTDVDGEVRLDMWEGRRPPVPHEEVTIGGKTVEVVGVNKEHDGSVWITADNGDRIRWD